MKAYANAKLDNPGILANLGSSPGARIFYVSPQFGGKFRLIEACDDYFEVELSADELRQLGEELIAIADGEMEAP